MHVKTYRIAYAYPTSPTADALNDGDGCWYVQCEAQREDGSFYTAPVVDAFPAECHDGFIVVTFGGKRVDNWRGVE